MAYETDMGQAALRHYSDGMKLLNSNCYDNAGYHFGFAAECATKSQLLKSGVRADDDAIWAHFQALRTLALLAINGRANAELFRTLSRQSFMQEWDIKMRYAKNGSVTQLLANRWRADADEMLGLMI
jgi:hypothetical protein